MKPPATYFRPVGIALYELESISIDAPHLEVLALVDGTGLSQIEAAARLGVHQSTVARMLARARASLVKALMHGHAIRLTSVESDA